MALFKKRGGFFPEYLVYDGGPLDEDGKKDGVVTYTTFWGTGPLSIEGIGDYVRETLGQDVPSGVPDVLYSHVDSKAQKSDVASHVLLYTYGHADPETGEIEPISPGAHLHVEPGEKLDINVIYGYESTNDFDIRSLKKKPVLKVGGVGFIDSGAAGSTNLHLHGTNVASDGFGDNVKAEYSNNFKVSYKFPKSHNLGLQWWHPHFHGSANSQVYGGAFANLSVGDPLEYLGEEFKDARRSYIGIKNFNLNYSQETGKFELATSAFTPEETARNIYLLNGEYKPEKDGYETGEWNAFSFINYSSNSFYNVKIVKPVKGKTFDVDDPSTWESVDTYLYARDGYQSNSINQTRTGNNNSILNGLQIEDPVNGEFQPLPAPELENNHFLSPAKRQEVLAYFEEPGEYKIISEAWTGAGLRAGGWIWPNIELGTLNVSGDKADAPERLPTEVTPEKSAPAINDDLSQYEPLQVRRMTWSGNLFVEGANRYQKINGGLYNTNETLINDRPNRYGGYPTPFLLNDNVLPFNPALITQLDTLEFWDHEQWASEQHPFHPHQNHFQIIDPAITGNTGNAELLPKGKAQPESQKSRSVIQLFIAYLGRFPDPDELNSEIRFLKKGGGEKRLAKRLTSGPYQEEFEDFYINNFDSTRDKDLQIADGAFYTITRSNVFNPANTFFWANELKSVGVKDFPLYMLNHFRNGGSGSPSDIEAQQRLDNVVELGLYAINQAATREQRPLKSSSTALFRVLNQQITADQRTNTELQNVIDQALGFEHSDQDNGEGFFGSDFRQDTVALQSALPKRQSYSLPSSNRYPAPANYNEWEPSRMTTATIYENFTGGYMQHCHILPHEDSGQGILLKTIDNLDRTWTADRSTFAAGEEVIIKKASNYESVVLPTQAASHGHEIAFGDVNKDGFVDVILGKAKGGDDLVRVFSGRDLSEMDRFNAFQGEKNWKAGVHLGVGDMTGDALKDVVISAGEGGDGRISVWSNSKAEDGFFHAGDITSFAWDPTLRDSKDTRFVVGDFDTDNFGDIAIVGSEKEGSPIQVISSKNNVTLSTFYPEMKGKLSLSSGFSSWHNLGLETLVIYQKEAKSAQVKTATMRAASYVAHSTGDFNPFFDEAKYSSYSGDDFQVKSTSPVDRLTPIDSGYGFDWLVNDELSLSDLKKRGGGADLQLKQTYSGYLANPVTVASVGNATDTYAYLDQNNTFRLPELSNDNQLTKAQKQVIEIFVDEIDRLPTPEELARFSTRLLGGAYGSQSSRPAENTSYLRKVLRYNGEFDAKDPVASDAILGLFYDHALDEVTYAQAGIVDFSDRRTYSNLADDRGKKDPATYSENDLNRISEFGLYAIAQLGNSINIDGDIQMFLGQSSKLKSLLSSSYRELGSGNSTLKIAKEDLNSVLKGDYIYPGDEKNAGSSPLQNGLNVESASFKDSEFNTLNSAFSANETTKFARIGEAHGNHGGHSHSHAEDLSRKDLIRIHGTRSVDRRIGGAQNDRLQPTRSNKAFNATGGVGHDQLFGGSKRDSLNGGDDNDLLSGGAGRDTLIGGKGDDVLFGGRGRDRLTGGDGADQFQLLNSRKIASSNADVITDFNGVPTGDSDGHDHASHIASDTSQGNDISLSTKDQLIVDSSLLKIDYVPHLHVAQSMNELRRYWNSDHVSILYLQPTGQLFLNYQRVPTKDYESVGLIATLSGSPDLSESSIVYI